VESIPNEITVFFFIVSITSRRTVALGPTEPLTHISTRDIPVVEARPAREAKKFLAVEPIF
jgi:hypothetical protein